MPPGRIPFDSLCLAAAVAEARPYVGGKVQRIWQPDASTVVFNLYHQGREAYFLASCHPVFARAHLATRRPQSAQPLPGLAQALRARVDGARLVEMRQIGFDRVLWLHFAGREGEHALVCELMGKHANLMLLDPDRRVVAAAKWVVRSKSVRPITPGSPYQPPPFPARRSLLEAQEGEPLEELEGASPFLRRLLAASGAGALARVQAAVRDGRYDPVSVPGAGAYPISVAPLGYSEQPRSSYSLAIELHVESALVEDRAAALREGLLAQLRRVALAREVALADLRQAKEAAARATEFQQTGELILAYGPSAPVGARSLEAVDYGGNAVTLALDPAKSYLENAQSWFDRAKRAKAREGLVTEQIERLSEDKDRLEGLAAEVLRETRLDRLEELRDQARQRRWLHEAPSQRASKAPEDRPYQGHRVREALAPGGYTVLYGENAEANDFLTLRVAKPNDWWVHVRGHTSAHVVIVTGGKPERVGKETLLFAAKLAVRHSALKHSGYVPVDYTLRKYVRKPRGAPKGAALYTHEKTLHVSLD